MATLASAPPLTLSTNSIMRWVISTERGPSGAKKFWSSGCRSRWTPKPLSTENANASSGTNASMVVYTRLIARRLNSPCMRSRSSA